MNHSDPQATGTPEAEASAETAPDTVLGGRVALFQPDQGYRAAIDPVLLAAFTSARSGERVLDIGTGVGTAALCLAVRQPAARIIGLEPVDAFADLAARNVDLNGRRGRVIVMRGDLLRPPPALAPGSFDRVMMNPPYLKADASDPSPEPLRAVADTEGEAKLADWIHFAGVMLRTGGALTMVHRADRVGEIVALLAKRFGGLILFPLWPAAGKPAKRVLVAAARGSKAPATIAPGLVLHGADGAFTPEAEAILRDGAPLTLPD